jgi:GLPGLI family protein
MQKNIFSTLLVVVLLGSSAAVFAQVKATVTYEETYHFEIPEEFKARMPANSPTKAEAVKILEIVDKQSYFKNAPVKEDLTPNLENRDGNRGGGMRFMSRMAGGNEEIYTDLTTKTQLVKANFFNKDFILKENFDKYKWRVVASEQRDILGYTCMKAEYRDSVSTVTVWFTPQIQLHHGPFGLHGLPGLILAASVGENRILLAKTINLKDENVTITAIEDKKGSMTREAYNKMIKERMEEMRSMMGSRRPGG